MADREAVADVLWNSPAADGADNDFTWDACLRAADALLARFTVVEIPEPGYIALRHPTGEYKTNDEIRAEAAPISKGSDT